MGAGPSGAVLGADRRQSVGWAVLKLARWGRGLAGGRTRPRKGRSWRRSQTGWAGEPGGEPGRGPAKGGGAGGAGLGRGRGSVSPRRGPGPRAHLSWTLSRARPRAARPAICRLRAGGGGGLPAPCWPLLPACGPPASPPAAGRSAREETAVGAAPAAKVQRDNGRLRRDAGRGGRNDQQVRAGSCRGRPALGTRHVGSGPLPRPSRGPARRPGAGGLSPRAPASARAPRWPRIPARSAVASPVSRSHAFALPPGALRPGLAAAHERFH